MRILISYSSRTGNTRALAEALHLALPNADLCPVGSAPSLDQYDLVFVGFWVESGGANAEAVKCLNRLDGKPVALFATLGAYPDSRHAAECMRAASAEVAGGNVLDTFICQGAIDPKAIEWMEQLPADDENAPTAERRQLWRDAASHPDASDIQAVTEWAAAVLARVSAD